MMDVDGSAAASMGAAAAENLRPHCQSPGACVAKTVLKHCGRCAAAAPEVRARKSAALRKLLECPLVRARKAEVARRASADPKVIEKRSAAMRRRWKDPAYREQLSEALRAGWAKSLADPVFAEEQRQRGMILKTPENRVKMGRSRSETALRWCPREYRQENVRLGRLGYRLPERKRMIAELAAIEARRAIRDCTQAMIARHEREKARI